MTEQRTEILLLWDMAESTKLLIDVRPDRYELLAGQMKSAMDKVVTDYGGTPLRDTGDGGWATFASAQRAIDGAVAMLRRARQVSENPNRLTAPIRIVVTAGDVQISHDGDRNGVAINSAARIEADNGLDGDILCTSTVVELARGWGGHDGEYLGHFELRSIPGEIGVHRIQWRRSPIAERLGLPSSLSDEGRPHFVGRRSELERLTGIWDQLPDTGAQLVSVSGGAGFGKTRFGGELARRVRAQNGIVLYGRCDEYAGYAYEPYVQAIESYLDAATDLTLDLGSHASELSRIVPAIGDRIRDLAEPPAVDPGLGRHRLFDAIGGWLGLVATEAPTLLVIDDFTWATEATVRLTSHLSGSLAGTPILVLVTMRPREATTAARSIDRHVDHRFELQVFDEDEALQLAARTTGGELDDANRRAILELHDATGGNPFMMAELLKELAQGPNRRSGRVIGLDTTLADQIPVAVRLHVLERVAGLSPLAQRFVRLAALAGERFDPRVVQHVLGVETGAGRSMAEAEQADLVRHTGGIGEFAHSIVRQVILQEPTTDTDRSEQHRRIGEAIEELHTDPSDRHYESLAYQFSNCVGYRERAKAVTYARFAAAAAVDRLAHDQAAASLRLALRLGLESAGWRRMAPPITGPTTPAAPTAPNDGDPQPELVATDPQLRRALLAGAIDDDRSLDRVLTLIGDVEVFRDDFLDWLTGSAPADRVEICATMVELGRALKWAGRSEARAVLRLAAREAIRLQSTAERVVAADLCADALLADARGIFAWAGTTDVERVALLDDARTLAIDPLKATLVQANLAAELPFSRTDRHLELSSEALDRARSLVRAKEQGEAWPSDLRQARTILARVLNLHLGCLWRPDRIDERMALGAELQELCRDLHRPSLTLQAATSAFQAAMEGGQFGQAPELLATIERAATELRQPITVGYAKLRQANWAAVGGNLDESNRLALEAFKAAKEAGQPDAEAFYAGQQFLIMLHRGEVVKVASQIDQMIEQYPAIGGFRSAGGVGWVEAGDADRAATALRSIMEGIDEVTFDLNWLVAMALACYPAWFVRDEAAAAVLLDKIDPYEHRFVDIASGFYGAVRHYKALLLDCLGRWVGPDGADATFEQAAEAHHQIPSPPWEARTLLDWGLSLRRRGDGYEDQATSRLDEAAAVADRAGLAALAVRIERLRTDGIPAVMSGQASR